MAELPAPKKRGRKPKLDATLVAAALVRAGGNVDRVAKKFGVARSSLAEFIDNRDALRSVLYDAREGMLDDAESALFKAVRKGQGWAVCFFLKTQGRGRGYIERQVDLPPLEQLLAALPADVASVVRAALAQALQRRRDGGGDRPRAAIAE
jgi:hypothetical protein